MLLDWAVSPTCVTSLRFRIVLQSWWLCSMRKPQGTKANHNERRKVQKDEERRNKRQRSEEPGMCPPSSPSSPFPDLCYVDATPGAEKRMT